MSSFSSQASHSGLSSRTNSSRPQAQAQAPAQAHPRSDKSIKRPRSQAEHGCRPNCMHTSEPGPCSLQCGHKGIRTEFSHSRHIYSAHGHTRTGTSDGLGWPFRPSIKFGRCLPHRPDSPASSSSCNEAPGPVASSDFILQPNKFQAPATPINPSSSINANRCPSTHKVIQVPPDSLDSPISSSPHSISFPTTPIRPHPHRPRSTYSFLKPSPSSSSFDTTSSVSSPLRLPYPLPESPSPSPSPRSRKSGTRSTTPSCLSPAAFLIRRGLVPQRAQPTLAMSIQIHTPTPIRSSQPLSQPSNPRSNPHSEPTPTSPLAPPIQLTSSRPPMPRPSSRSEKLLRDTLRRDEQERLANLATLPSPHLVGAPNPHGFIHAHIPSDHRGARNHIRRNTSSSAETSTSSESDYIASERYDYSPEEDADEDQGWLWRSRPTPSGSGASSASGNHPTNNYFNNTQHMSRTSHHSHGRHTSMDRDQQGHRSRRRTEPSVERGFDPSLAYGTPTSPTPPRAQLHRSPNSAPNVPRTSRRTSVDGRKHDGSNAACGTNGGSVTAPHGAVLQSRLEGVLKNATHPDRRARSRERGGSGSTSGSGNSMASSRNLSGEGEWPFGETYNTSPTSDPSLSGNAASRANFSPQRPPTLELPRSPKSSHSTPRSPNSPHKFSSPTSPRRSPLTPPSTPHFDPHTASAQCRAKAGYVSFADVEGLGVPDGDVDYSDDADDKAAGGWLPKWLPKVGRGRSDSASSYPVR